MNQQPSIGRIVHYHSYGTPGGEFKPEPRAAVITAIGGVGFKRKDGQYTPVPEVSLCVLNPTGMFFNQNVPYSETPKPGCWSWPPRV